MDVFRKTLIKSKSLCKGILMSEHINIYWASGHYINFDNGLLWEILYKEPESLYKSLSKNIDKESKETFFQCPSFKDLASETFIIKNPLDIDIKINNGEVFETTKNRLNCAVLHSPSIKNNILVQPQIHYIFFAEESVEIDITPPFFHNVGYSQQAATVPGSMDIGSWFRQVSIEMNVWEDSGALSIKENEPVAYIRFNTKKKINFKRFTMNKNLFDIAQSCSTSSNWEPKVSLLKRYKRFKDAKIQDLVLREIRKNLVNE